jgi:hypothetical protein
MKKTIIIGFAVALLALSASQVLALQTGTWTCMGYTITVTPNDPDNPGLGGAIQIVKSDDYADVNVSGTYWKEQGRRPATVVDLAGTVTTPDGETQVARQFKFQPGPQKTVWKTVISWLESQIVG